MYNSDLQPPNKPLALVIIAAVLLAGGVVGVYAFVRSSISAAPTTSGTIATADCLRENGAVTVVGSRTCQIGTVQLSLIDN